MQKSIGTSSSKNMQFATLLFIKVRVALKKTPNFRIFIFFKKIEWHFDGELKKKSSVEKANLNVLKRKSAQKKMVFELGKLILVMSKVNVVD